MIDAPASVRRVLDEAEVVMTELRAMQTPDAVALGQA